MKRGSEENRPPLICQKPTLGEVTWAFSQLEEGPEGLPLGGCRAAHGGGQRASPPVPPHPRRRPGAHLLSSAAPRGGYLSERCWEGLFSRERSRGAEDRRTLTGPVPRPVCATQTSAGPTALRRPWSTPGSASARPPDSPGRTSRPGFLSTASVERGPGSILPSPCTSAKEQSLGADGAGGLPGVRSCSPPKRNTSPASP